MSNNLMLEHLTVSPGATITVTDQMGELICIDVVDVRPDGTVNLQLRQLRPSQQPTIGRFIDHLPLFEE